jgi:hypothetical protein
MTNEVPPCSMEHVYVSNHSLPLISVSTPPLLLLPPVVLLLLPWVASGGISAIQFGGTVRKEPSGEDTGRLWMVEWVEGEGEGGDPAGRSTSSMEANE